MFLTLLLVCTSIGIAGSKLACLDEEGAPVDMFILYKFPQIDWYQDSHVPHVVNAGKGYAYLDSNDLSLRFGNDSIGNSDSPPGRTLNQVYKKHYYFQQKKKMGKMSLDLVDDMAHIFYNSISPEGEDFFENGDTKGALGFDNESGFWLITSAPNFPSNIEDGYRYPRAGEGLKYGHIMMCVTFNSSVFNDIGFQLLYTNPHVHDGHLPTSWNENYSNLVAVLRGVVINEKFLNTSVAKYKTLQYNIAPLVSIGGYEYVHFSKSVAFRKDLYADIVAPSLKSDLICETWQHGRNLGASCDGEFTVKDVKKLNVSLPDDDLVFSFDSLYDKSKFCVSNSKENPVVCVGDVNRQISQLNRGGGCLCVNNKFIWQQVQKIIVENTECDQKDEL